MNTIEGTQGPDADDRQKLHSEVLQIVNQRLTITTLAVTIFVAMIAFQLTKTDSPVITSFTWIASNLLVLVLFFLYLLTHHLSYMLRTFSTYLDVHDGSNWEKDWALYRAKFSYLGYTKPQTLVFLALGTISGMAPYFLSLLHSQQVPFDWMQLFGLALLLGYIVLVFGMGWMQWFAKETTLRGNWELLHTRPSQQLK